MTDSTQIITEEAVDLHGKPELTTLSKQNEVEILPHASMPSTNVEGYYISGKRKVIDFLLGFIALSLVEAIPFTLIPVLLYPLLAWIFGENFFTFFVIPYGTLIATHLAIIYYFYRRGRKYIALGSAFSFVTAAIALGTLVAFVGVFLGMTGFKG